MKSWNVWSRRHFRTVSSFYLWGKLRPKDAKWCGWLLYGTALGREVGTLDKWFSYRCCGIPPSESTSGHSGTGCKDSMGERNYGSSCLADLVNTGVGFTHFKTNYIEYSSTPKIRKLPELSAPPFLALLWVGWSRTFTVNEKVAPDEVWGFVPFRMKFLGRHF